jgi:glycosyltransferase involved in cell wall biosynthesis
MAEIPSILAAADVLVSARSRGTNTPLKIYSYLTAGRPIVATDIVSHTQVLDASCAELVEPSPAGLAAGLRAVLGDPSVARRLASGAAAAAAGHYSPRAYLAGVARAYAALGAPMPDDAALDAALVRLLDR